MKKRPELLAPAGDLEKLKIAVLYGADAVYIGGQQFGLRARAKNFTLTEMEEGIKFAHKNGAKVYVAANIFAHNRDFEGMDVFFKNMEDIGANGLIISDPGVYLTARETVKNMEIHISTQANNTNYKTALFWYNQGAKRIVLARELSFGEIGEIKSNIPADMELEAFVHGAMCISYSGRCLLSNYLTDRDSNQGQCSHPCRWRYNIVEETRPGEYMPIQEDERGTYIFNSKDLCMIEHIPELIDSGIDSFKIEGRIKTSYYVATVVKAYRKAIDDYLTDPSVYEKNKQSYINLIGHASNRDFTTGFYFSRPGANEHIYGESTYVRNYDFVGLVMDYDEKTGMAKIEQRNKFANGDKVFFLKPENEGFSQTITEILDENFKVIESAPHPKQIVYLKTKQKLKEYDILYKPRQNN